MITPVTPIPQKKVPKPAPWKFWVMGGITVLFAIVFWWTLDMALQRKLTSLPSWEQAMQFLISLTFFCITLSLFGVLAMAAKRQRWWITALTAALAALALLPFFPWRLATLGAVGITLAGFWLWSWNIAGDVAGRKKFQPHYTIHAGFGTGLVLLLVGVSMCYYTSLGDSRKTAEEVRTGMIGAARNGIDFYLPKQIPGYTGSMTLDQFLSLVATDKFGEFIVPQITQTLDSDTKKEEAYKQITDQLSKVNPVFSTPQVSSELQKQLNSQLDAQRAVLQEEALKQLSAAQRQLLEEARREFLASFKIEATGSESMDTIIERILTRNVTRYVDPYERLIPPILALSFFFIIELISVVYRYVIFALAPLVAWVYRKFGLLRLETQVQTVQELEV
jgi:hypothetical protein